jgi:hypothetical protein
MKYGMSQQSRPLTNRQHVETDMPAITDCTEKGLYNFLSNIAVKMKLSPAHGNESGVYTHLD